MANQKSIISRWFRGDNQQKIIYWQKFVVARTTGWECWDYRTRTKKSKWQELKPDLVHRMKMIQGFTLITWLFLLSQAPVFFCFPLPVSALVLSSVCPPRQNSLRPSPPSASHFGATWRIQWSLRFSTPLISKTDWDCSYHSQSPANRGGPQHEFRRQCSRRRPVCKIWPWGIQDYPIKKAYGIQLGNRRKGNFTQTLNNNQLIEALTYHLFCERGMLPRLWVIKWCRSDCFTLKGKPCPNFR